MLQNEEFIRIGPSSEKMKFLFVIKLFSGLNILNHSEAGAWSEYYNLISRAPMWGTFDSLIF